MSEKINPKILIVEDNIELAENLKLALTMKKYDINIAFCGKDALKIINNSDKPDLIILDIMLPDITGWEILIKVKSNPLTEHLPIIMLTAIDDETSEANALYDGADDYITKPYRIKTLLARIEALLRRSEVINAKPYVLAVDVEPLSEREKEVLKCLTEGLSNNDISARLSISRLTVEGHVKKILEKLKVENRTKAAIMGIKCRLV